jgi:DNA-binding CsgD family transcriptional regulator
MVRVRQATRQRPPGQVEVSSSPARGREPAGTKAAVPEPPSPTAPSPLGGADPAFLIRRLVEQSGRAGPAPEAPVLLDMEVDGVRCVLVRARHDGRPPLSPREQEIARMVAKGYPNKVIADVLEISCWTVGTHLRRIFAKLAVSSRAAMVAKLLEESLPP